MAIEARAERLPDEAPYAYAPFTGVAMGPGYGDARKQALENYNTKDLSI